MTRLKDSIFSKISICFLLVVSMGFPAITTAGIQVVGLIDRATSSSGSGTAGAARSSAAGSSVVSDNFCVVSDTSGAVNLRFTNSSGAAGDGQSWFARNSAGLGMAYLQSVSNADGSMSVLLSQPGNENFLVTAVRAVASSAQCGSGNVTKTVSPTSGQVPINGGVFSDTVTVVASPR